MFCWKSNLIWLLALLSLSGCGGFYTYDKYFGPEESDGWSKRWDYSRDSSYSCSRRTAVFQSSELSARRTAYGVLGVPVLPVSETLIEENQEAVLGFVLLFRDAPPATCSVTDVRIVTAPNSLEVKPSTAAMDYKVSEREYRCKYQFDMKQASVTEFSLIVSREKNGCQSPLLKVKRTSGYLYRFYPP
jgi:hypothetical protein